MAVESSLPALLTTLSQSLASALESTPEPSVILPPSDGISLLDVKNDLFLSYLQNLVFLIILKLRNRNRHGDATDSELDDTVVKKLVEMRVYLEKGVRPLEARLKYQIDKVLRATDDAARAALPIANGAKKNIHTSDLEDESDSDQDAETTIKASDIDDLQYRPNATSFITSAANETEAAEREEQDGLYRPPRITATAMPTTMGKAEKENKRANVSRTLEEFVNTELSSAPLAQPSIGSNTVAGGRRSKSDREKKDEQERKEYEEKNYVRLPKESKKDRAKKGRPRDAGYGGEEWRGLGEGIDRIDRLTKRKAGEGRNVLEKSRKRATEDGPKSSGGLEVGQGFAKRLKTMGKERQRGKK